MNYRLISFDICPFVQRSMITLREKGVEFDTTYIDLADPPVWFLALSPMGKVPLLEVNGETAVFESAVINEYLDEVTTPQMHPQNPLRKAHNRAWIEFGSNLIGKQYGMLVSKTEEAYKQSRVELREGLERVSAELDGGPFMNGVSMSLVDTAYAPIFMRCKLMDSITGENIYESMPKIAAWSDALLEKDSVTGSVVDDFENRFKKYAVEHGDYFGKLCG